MSFEDIRQEALALPECERATLAATLLETIDPSDKDISDQEVAQRDRDLESGAEEPISHEEFLRRVEQERNR